MAFTARSTVRELMANPQARAIVDRHIPGASNHPQLYEAMYMSLGEVATYPESGLNQAKLQALLADLATIPD